MDWLARIALDKQAHALLGHSVSSSVGFTVLLLWLAITGSISLLGTVLAMLAGAVSGSGVNWWKDYIHDKAHPETNTFDPRDFHAGALGSIIGAMEVGLVAMVVWLACLLVT